MDVRWTTSLAIHLCRVVVDVLTMQLPGGSYRAYVRNGMRPFVEDHWMHEWPWPEHDWMEERRRLLLGDGLRLSRTG